MYSIRPLLKIPLSHADVAAVSDDEVDDARGAGDADPLEDDDERALVGGQVVPDDERHDHRHRRRRRRCRMRITMLLIARGSVSLGVLRLPRRHADQLDADEGEHHDLQASERAAEALRGTAPPSVPQVLHGRTVTERAESNARRRCR